MASADGLLAAEHLTKAVRERRRAQRRLASPSPTASPASSARTARARARRSRSSSACCSPRRARPRCSARTPRKASTCAARLGYMPEHDCLPSQVSAAEFLTHMAELSGLPPSTARTRAADTLRHTGLFEERYRAIGGYSTGMKQRVKLGQALVHDPAFVFLDEPTAGLDPVGREEMLTLIRKTHREFGISVLLSSHLMADVERTCDRIIVLQGGRLVHSGEVAQFTKETETVFIEVDTNREQLVRGARAARRRRDARRRRPHHRGPGRIRLRPRPRRARRSTGAAAPDGAAPTRADRALRAGGRMTVPRPCRSTARPPRAPSSTSATRATPAGAKGEAAARTAVFKDGVRTALGLGRGGAPRSCRGSSSACSSVIALIMAIIAGAAERLGGPGRRGEDEPAVARRLLRHRVDHHVRVRGASSRPSCSAATGATA